MSANGKKPQIEASWLAVLEDEFEKDYMQDLRAFLKEEKQSHTVYPPGNEIFNAFELTPFDDVRVVVLGQDPYHGANQAHGLSFSVKRGVKTPPSLKNIYKEIHESLGLPIPAHGELTHWAEQGVLLLNTTLTVRARSPKSHAGKGWEEFTDRVIDVLNEQRQDIVFLLWGRHAQSKAARIDTMRHLVLKAAHPSPYSARNGFFGCNHFAKVNQHLESLGQAPIDWSIPE